MGYVHDIYLDLDCDRTAFAAAFADIRTLFRRAELPIAGPAGRPGTTPVLDDDFIGFNGISSFCTCDPGGPDYHGFRSCQYTTCRPKYFDNNCGQPFVIDLKPDRPYGISQLGGRYWIDCKTFRRPYDQAVMLAMIALEHHLGDQAEMHSKGRWDIEWSHGGDAWDWLVGRRLHGPFDIYTHVFPDRAPVRDVLCSEGMGW